MPGHRENAVNRGAQEVPQDFQRYLFLSSVLQVRVARGTYRFCRRDADV